MRSIRRVVGLGVAAAVALGGLSPAEVDAAAATDPEVVVWGVNGDFQPMTPAPAGLTGVVEVAADGYHSLALKDDGTVVAWGSNYYGETSVPGDLSGVADIEPGVLFSLALLDDGTVRGWGANHSGQATPPPWLDDATAISGGYSHSLALRQDGTVAAWGSNPWGESSVPADLVGVEAVAAGAEFSAALLDDGTVTTWGRLSPSATPAGLSDVTAIAAGNTHVAALRSDGTVVTWGPYYAPTELAFTDVAAVSVGQNSTTVLKDDGTVESNGFPPPAGLSGVTAIATGWFHGVALSPLAPGIHGTVSDGSSPLGGITAQVYDESLPAAQNPVAEVVTAPDGGYSFTNLTPSTTLKLRFADPAGAFAPRWHGSTTWAGATTLSWAPDQVVRIADAVLVADSVVTGTATLPGNAPAVGIQVEVRRVGGTRARSATTGSDGSFVVGGLPAGDYQVRFRRSEATTAVSFAGPGAISLRRSGAATVSLTVGETEVVDALLPRLSISGTVTDRRGPLAGHEVMIWKVGATTKLRKVVTNADGEYDADRLPAGDYWVQFVRGDTHTAGWYAGAASVAANRAGASTVTVTSTGSGAVADAVLARL